MMMHSRYEFVRNRLIELYNIVQHRTYKIWIAPEKLMSLDQLRSRPTYTQEGFANDGDFYSEKRMWTYRIPQMLNLLGNIQNVHDFDFDKPSKTIVEIYESIIEYVSLWCEIYKNAPEFKTPPYQELRRLENFAYILFSEYKRIKPFVKREGNKKLYQNDSTLESKGLAGLHALFTRISMHSGQGDGEISFYSHLDEIMPQHAQNVSAPMYLPPVFNPFVPNHTVTIQQQQDTLFSGVTAHQHAVDPNWIFKAG